MLGLLLRNIFSYQQIPYEFQQQHETTKQPFTCLFYHRALDETEPVSGKEILGRE